MGYFRTEHWWQIALDVLTAGSYSAYKNASDFLSGLNEAPKTLDSPETFGFDQAETGAEAGIPIPVVYGKRYLPGNVLSAYLDNDGDMQRFYFLLGLCEGPVESVAGYDADMDVDISYDTDICEDALRNRNSNYSGGTSASSRQFDGVDLSGDVDESTSSILFYARCEDPDEIVADSQLEITSSGGANDINEKSYTDLTQLGLARHWQRFELRVSEFTDQGGAIDWSNVNYIRIYNNGTTKTVIEAKKFKLRTYSLTLIGDKVKINGSDIDNYDRLGFGIRLGACNQDPIDGFEATHSLVTHSRQVDQADSSPYQFDTSASDMDEVWLNFVWPGGVYRTSSSGGTSGENCVVQIEIKKFGDPTYTPYYVSPATNQLFDTEGEAKSYVQSTSSTCRQTYKFTGLERGTKYSFQITKMTGDTRSSGGKQYTSDTVLSTVDEIIHESFSYPYTALFAVKGVASNQLEGSLPSFLIEVEGLKPDGVYTNNPIDCIKDLLTNKQYGLGKYVDEDAVDDARWATESAFCDTLVSDGDGGTEKIYELDLVINNARSAPDQIRSIMETVSGRIVWLEGKAVPIIDRSAACVALFGMGNIIKNSFACQFTPLSGRMEQVEVQYVNQSDNKTDSVIVQLASDTGAEGDLKRQSVSVAGVVRRSQCARLGLAMLKTGVYCPRSLSFTTVSNADHLTVGDVIGFNHDVPGVGLASGRAQGGGAHSIIVDQTMTLAAGVQYYVSVQHNADNSIETIAVSGLGGGTYNAGDSIDVIGLWTLAPAENDNYSIGPTDPAYKEYRISTLSREENGEVAIEAVEYSENVYDLSDLLVEEPPETVLPDPRKPPAPVGDLTGLNSGGYDLSIKLSWEVPRVDTAYGMWDYAEIFVSEDDGRSWSSRGVSNGHGFEMFGFTPGKTYLCRVVSVSTWGRRTEFGASPTVDVTVGLSVLPPNVTGLEIRNQGNNREFQGKNVTFCWKEPAVGTTGYPVGEEPLGFGSGTRDQWFSHYQVDIWSEDDAGNGVLRRREVVYQPTYTYTYEMNCEDHAGSPQRVFSIAVWTWDKYGQHSEKTGWLEGSSLEVYNVGPTIAEYTPGVPVKTSRIWKATATSGEYQHIANEVRWDPSAQINDPDFRYFVVQYTRSGVTTYQYVMSGGVLTMTPDDSLEFGPVNVNPHDWFGAGGTRQNIGWDDEYL